MRAQPGGFAKSADTRVEACFKSGRQIYVQKGQYIIRGEDEPQGVYYLSSGLIRAFGINQRGEEYTFAIIAPGEAFPLNWLTEKINRQIFFQALTTGELYLLSREDVLRQAQADGLFCYGLLHKALDDVGLLIDRIDNLEYKYASERLAYRLLFLAKRFGEKQPDGSYLIRVPVSQQIIASSINASRESVNREFERLQQKGYVRFTGPLISITDIEALKHMFPVPLSPNWWEME